MSRKTLARPQVNTKWQKSFARPNWPALAVLVALAIFWVPFIPFFVSFFSWLLSLIETVFEFITGGLLIIVLVILFGGALAGIGMLLGGAIPRSWE